MASSLIAALGYSDELEESHFQVTPSRSAPNHVRPGQVYELFFLGNE